MSKKTTPLTPASSAKRAPRRGEGILILDNMAEGSSPDAPEPVLPAPPIVRTKPTRAKIAAKPRAQGDVAYALAAAATLLWAGCLTAFVLGYRSHLRPFDYEPFAATVLALLALAPIGLIWIGAFALRQGIRLLAETRRMQALSDNMLGPAALAAAGAGSAVEAIRLETAGALQMAGEARNQLQQLRQELSYEAQKLVDAVAGSGRAGAAAVQNLKDEREGFSALADKLETLAARATELAAAAGQATDTARTASEDLSRQTARLEAAGVTVGEQAQAVEQGLGHQRSALVSLAEAMRADQEKLGGDFERQQAQFIDILRQSDEQTQQVSAAASRGAEILRDLIGEAVAQLRDMSEQAQTERDLLGGAALQSLGAFSEAAAFERRALEEETRRAIGELGDAAEAAHRAAELASDAARRKVEQLAEAAFAAGQQADASFDIRLSEARTLIQRSVDLIDEAGQRSVARLDEGVAAARTALDELQSGLSEIDARSTRLPAEAEARGLEFKAALDAATEALLASAHTASRELETIDKAFQDRVKRNYEMLSEAARLMSVVGGGGARGAAGRSLRPRIGESDEPPALTRRRLKLTPPAEDMDLDADAAAVPAPAAAGDVFSWTELLPSLNGGLIEDGDLEGPLYEEIEALGIDLAALMPQARLEEIAAALESGDAGGARAMAHRLAPAAIRKLARRVLADKVLRSQADLFVEQQTAKLQDSVRQGQTRIGIAQDLSSQTGRAYLMFDAVVGDLS